MLLVSYIILERLATFNNAASVTSLDTKFLTVWLYANMYLTRTGFAEVCQHICQSTGAYYNHTWNICPEVVSLALQRKQDL